MKEGRNERRKEGRNPDQTPLISKRETQLRPERRRTVHDRCGGTIYLGDRRRRRKPWVFWEKRACRPRKKISCRYCCQGEIRCALSTPWRLSSLGYLRLPPLFLSLVDYFARFGFPSSPLPFPNSKFHYIVCYWILVFWFFFPPLACWVSVNFLYSTIANSI